VIPGIPRYGELAGRVAVVTGSAQGIGRGICRAMAEQGIVVFGFDLHEASDEGVLHRAVDVTDEAALADAFAEIDARAGGLDILVNNARREVTGPVIDIPLADWDATSEVLFRSHLLAARLAIPRMIAGGGGSVVTITSPHSRLAVGSYGAYGVAKAAAERLAQQIAFEYGRSGIRANSVSPGSVLTELKQRMVDEEPALAARLTAVQAMDELVTPRDIAAVVLALASDGFRLVTGQTIFVDGGLTIAMPRSST
jgi:gluconate 5-dehydrogenase